MTTYPKRLIEVDLPIKRISEHARREKSIRHGHISTLHIWWARRPLAACRAVLCAALWPDPADPNCPQVFRDGASRLINEFARNAVVDKDLAGHCSHESWTKWQKLSNSGGLDPAKEAHWNVLRFALLDFIADFANWDNSIVAKYLETSQSLTQVAHEALGGAPGTRPLVVDPFAGGGSIPLEALRVGADAFASDANPVAVLLNKVVLEYIPKYGQRLADAVRKWGAWIKEEAKKELAEFYPEYADGSIPIAYLWARTIKCEGPGCGSEVPLIRSLWLAKRVSRSVAIRLVPLPGKKSLEFEVVQNAGAKDGGDGTVRHGSVTCPRCAFTMPIGSVRRQLKLRGGGAADARLFCVVTTGQRAEGRSYRAPSKRDLQAVSQATHELERRIGLHTETQSLVPDEQISLNELRRISVPIYGMAKWGDLFAPRSALALTTLTRLVRQAGDMLLAQVGKEFAIAIQTCLAMAVDRQADYLSSLVIWSGSGEFIAHTFGRQALPMVWEWPECNLWASGSGNWDGAVEWVSKVIEANTFDGQVMGHAEWLSATDQSLPNDSAQCLFTDPPYYDAVPYAYLSDYFYVWLRRSLEGKHRDLLESAQVPKEAEIVVDRPHELSNSLKDVSFYERQLKKAFAESRRILHPDGIATIVFASKTTASWEAILQAITAAGWTITASWPIYTEREARVSAQGQARLASSIHLVCRPSKHVSGAADSETVGDWREVLAELPARIHDWMPRLQQEGIVGADAIFSCLGPALEIFSRYSRVEKASGENVPLKEFLEFVWAAVAKEALNMIFAGADATGFEEDARLTAIWLWTLSTGSNLDQAAPSATDNDEDDAASSKKLKMSGFVLEYDAARKIAQGLGAHLELLSNLVEISGDKARLLPVTERARHLFGKDEGAAPTKRKGKPRQLLLMDVLVETEDSDGGWGEKNAAKLGNTVLDRIHQSMILFAAGRGEALKRFLVGEGVGQDQRFWRLAQALSALYPKGTDERRWVEGVLARKKGLGF